MVFPAERNDLPIPLESEADMAIWTKPPECSVGALDRAGRALATLWSDSDLDLVDTWRSAHGFPLNTFQTNLRYRAKRVDSGALIAQRLKRLASIQGKLRRFPKMQLSTMQDIGGCRAIVKDMAALAKLKSAYIEDGFRIRNDYIDSPKEDGYRGVHIIGRYETDSESHRAWNGRSIEIQLRTKRQHAFATAVEVVGAMTSQPLKFGGGDPKWRRFFTLAGAAIAFTEGTSPVPSAPADETELASELRRVGIDLNVAHKFPAWNQALTRVPTKHVTNARAYVLLQDLEARTITLTPYRTPKEAAVVVLALEKDILKTGARRDVLQASAHSIRELRRAYPNYETDTREFFDDLLAFERARIQATKKDKS
jgi:hypothetical protein